ncbi:hypothetical protein [Niabella ginsengisoli]|uniref:VCBS repeat-containing protein n=1 Tax=Niabella ginsengisoli TaxID=522298 RepID=A0ABS9SJ28_9BACT|nr:hypothetical protein [Niabella ginsengisoli]MCH5598189.1 hypothetical protein [Niabella ginsengisoli]
MTESDRRFSYSEIDLNEDGKNEILVTMKGSYYCGNAGCTVYLLDNKGTKISGFTIVDGPVVIANSKTKNWSDLIIPSRGVNYLVKFDGKKYPGNPSMQPKFDGNIPAGLKVVLPNDAAVYTF